MTEITMPCRHDSPDQKPGQPCPICGKIPGESVKDPPGKPVAEEWKGEGNTRKKNA